MGANASNESGNSEVDEVVDEVQREMMRIMGAFDMCPECEQEIRSGVAHERKDCDCPGRRFIDRVLNVRRYDEHHHVVLVADLFEKEMEALSRVKVRKARE